MHPVIAMAIVASICALIAAREQSRRLEFGDVAAFIVPTLFCIWSCVAIALNI